MENSNFKTVLTEGNVKSLETFIQSEINIDIDALIGIHTPLTLVSELGHVDCVKTLIAHKANVNKRDFFDHTPLMRASKHGHLECMKVLIEANADVNYKNHETHVLFASASEGHVECVRLLIDNGADVNIGTFKGLAILPLVLEDIRFEDNLIKKIIEKSTDVHSMRNELGLSPIMIASQNGQTACLESLLRNVDGIDDVDKSGKTALMHASSHGHVDCAEKLIQAGADVNFVFRKVQQVKPVRPDWHSGANVGNHDSSKKSPRKPAKTFQSSLMLASDRGHVECVLKLIEMGADVNQKTFDGVTALMCATKSGHLPCVKALVSAGADVNYRNDDCTPVLRAAREGHSDCVEYLVNNGADWSVKTFSQSTLLHLLLKHRKTDKKLVEILIRKGLDANAKESDGKTLLMLAAQNGHIEILDLLMAEKMNVNDASSLGESALMLATSHGHTEAIEKLVERGADINFIGKFGYSALSTGCKLGKLDCVKMLIDKGAVINHSGKNNVIPPLIISLQANQLDCFYFLLENGADPNVKDESGRTILHTILEKETCDFELFQKCVNHGADLACTDDQGTTLLMLATKRGHESALNFLLENKANLDEEDKKGWCAVKYAVLKGRDICLQNLLNAGANITHKKKCVSSLMTIAVERDRILCVRIIGEHLRKTKYDRAYIISQMTKKRHFEHRSVDMVSSLAEFGFISLSALSHYMGFQDLLRVRTKIFELVTFFKRGQKETILTPFQAAFNNGDKDAIFYLLANLFLFERDVHFIFSDSEFLQVINPQNNSDRMKELRNQLTEQPWSLQTLSFIVISSRIKPFIMNEERKRSVDSLPVPEKFKNRLKFYDNIARLCPNDWSHILSESPGLDYLLKFDMPNWLERKTTVCNDKTCCKGKGFRLKKFEDEEIDSDDRSLCDSDSNSYSDYD